MTRLIRTFVQSIHAAPEQVFPLLCPEREKDWLPGWDARMIHSDTGVAEFGAVFASPHAAGRTLWVVTEYDPPRRVAFVRWQPDGLVAHIEIVLARHHDARTAVAIRYTFTATDDTGETAITGLSDARWRSDMTFWQESMKRWFDAHPTTANAAR